jgi:hypothetical protein
VVAPELPQNKALRLEEQGLNRDLRLAPDYRRCGTYLVVGWFLAIGIGVGLTVADLNDRSWAEMAAVLTILFVPTLGVALLTWRQALRVDERGLWRRRFFRWDLWPWDAFATGRIRAGSSKDSWVYPAKPWHCRYLFLDFLADTDRHALAEQIRQVWTPPVVAPPDMVQIRYGLWKRLELSPQGIVLFRGRRDPGRSYRWSEAVQVRVTRIDPSRQDFRTLNLELGCGAKPIRLHYQQGNRSWNGPDGETILAYLRQQVPADRIQMTSLTGPPQTRDEAYRRLQELDRSAGDLRKLGWVTGLGFVACVLILLFPMLEVHLHSPLDWDWFQWLAAGTFVFILILSGIVCWATLAELRRRLREGHAELATWASGEQQKASNKPAAAVAGKDSSPATAGSRIST